VQREAHVKHRTVVFAVMALCGATAACTEGGGQAEAGYTVRDSAGVRIVENTRATWAPAAGWTVPAEPTLSIGTMDGDADYQLYRVWTAFTLSDGRIVISNSGSRELKFFDPEGRYLMSAGGEGEGPGEFARLGPASSVSGDSVLGYDWLGRRVSLFDPAGGYVRSWRLEMEAGAGYPSVRGLLTDGSVLTQFIEYGQEDTEGFRRDTSKIVRFDPQGIPSDTLGRFPDREVLEHSQEVEGGTMMRTRDTPFGRDLSIAAFGEEVYAGDTGSYEIQAVSMDGAVRRIIRRDWRNPAVTDAMVEALREEELREAEDDNDRRRIQRDYDEMALFLHDTAPAFSDLMTDLEGNLWVHGYSLPGEPPAPWTVFDSEGIMLGDVDLPEGLRPLEVGSDYVMGRWRDDLGVDYVRRYALLKD